MATKCGFFLQCMTRLESNTVSLVTDDFTVLHMLTILGFLTFGGYSFYTVVGKVSEVLVHKYEYEKKKLDVPEVEKE